MQLESSVAFPEAGGHVTESQKEEVGTLSGDLGTRGLTEHFQLTQMVVARAPRSPETLFLKRRGALGTGRLAGNKKGQTPREGPKTLPPGVLQTKLTLPFHLAASTERLSRTLGGSAG